MKFSLISALFALSVAAVSAAPAADSDSEVIYVYLNSIPHPKTTFLKLSDNQVVTDGPGCKGNDTLPGKKGALSGTFTKVPNQWDFNGQHDNEIAMGYIKVDGGKCLSLVKGQALTVDTCPSFTEQIKVGNKFAWFHDKRNSATWAYGGDADAVENNGVIFDVTNFQSNGKTLTGTALNDDSLDNTFLGIGHVSLGHTGKRPQGCA